MKYKNIDRLIGKQLPKETIHEILELLDIRVDEKTESGFIAIVPPYRVDVTREADVIEEILRIYGYDNIELKAYASSEFLADFPASGPEATQLQASNFLVDNGFYEISTNSLTKPTYAEKTASLNAAENVVILNKLSEDLGVLRQSLLFSGLEVVAHNINRKQSNLKLFEFGTTYSKKSGSGYVEQSKLAIWMTGQNHKESWISKNNPVEFHDLSSVVIKLLQKFTSAGYKSIFSEEGIFKYGLSLQIEGRNVAKVGLLHKSVAAQLEITQDVFYAEVDFYGLLSTAKTGLNVEEISRFPEVRRDLSLVLDQAITFEQVKEVIEDREFSGVLKDINVFDYYVGEKIEKDKKAYALSFILQDKTKTLTDKVIDKIMNRLMNKFETKLGAVIRQ
jgi:phenylalanyl-tRNA synthetase beta chain